VQTCYNEALSSPLRADSHREEFTLLRQFATVYDSNTIENIGLPAEETMRLLCQLAKDGWSEFTYPEKPPGAKRSCQEVIYHWLALKALLDSPRQPDVLISEDIVLKIHGILFGGPSAQPSSLRTEAVANGAGHVYPSAKDLPASFAAMVQEWNAAWKKGVRNSQLAAYVAYSFVALHPFTDGNGRMSRMLMNYALILSGFPFTITVGAPSRTKHYIAALKYADTRDGPESLQPFVLLILFGCFEAWTNYKTFCRPAAAIQRASP
jgi:Fic family protein